MTFTVYELDYEGAAEVLGLDCSRPLPPRDLMTLNGTFLRYPILAIRNQQLTANQQATFSQQFGELHDAGNDVDQQEQPLGIGDGTKMTIVQSAKRGSDTEFVNMYRVYDALSDELKVRINGKFAWHRAGDVPDALTPMVHTHPETGRQALYVSPRFTVRIDGIDPGASAELLRSVFAVMSESRFRWRYRWRDRDLLMWDDRCLAHRATGGCALPETRHRTNVAGDRAAYHPN
jgi:taurine dioxygenase